MGNNIPRYIYIYIIFLYVAGELSTLVINAKLKHKEDLVFTSSKNPLYSKEMFSPHVQNVTVCPHMVSLKQHVNGTLMQCGGSVLTRTLTLTAAHCLIYGIETLILKFGSIHLFKGGVHHKATNIVIHEDFDPYILKNDIGLVSIFPAKLTYGYHIRPIKLPDRQKLLEYNWITIYGWGAIADDKSFSEILRRATLPIISKKKCRRLLKGTVPSNTFCSGYLDGHLDACMRIIISDLCSGEVIELGKEMQCVELGDETTIFKKGDSGGPAMARGRQLGIISFGEGCAVPLKPGVYTDLTRYVDWITNKKKLSYKLYRE